VTEPLRTRGAPGLDFAVIGAAKAGTTALFQMLRRHPELCLPEGKELPYFVAPKHTYFDSPEAFYADAFGPRQPGLLYGTATPQYLYGALLGPDSERVIAPPGESERQIPERIHAAYPNVKLIAILRDPVARARSHHRMSTMRSFEHRPFDQAIKELLDPGALAQSRARPTEIDGYVVLGEYGRLLHGYLKVFPREQLLVLSHEGLDRDPEAACREVFAFLAVDPEFTPPNLGRRYHEGGTQRRFAWMDVAAWQSAARRSSALRQVWGRLPRWLRLRAIGRFNRVERRLFFWNRVPVEPGGEPDPPAEQTLARLREHYREDQQLLEQLLRPAPAPGGEAPMPPPRPPAAEQAPRGSR
jgi:hypothetical protein